MIPVSFCVRLHLCVSSSRALSLPQSSPLYPVKLDSSLLRGSRGRSRAVHRIYILCVIPHSALFLYFPVRVVKLVRLIIRFRLIGLLGAGSGGFRRLCFGFLLLLKHLGVLFLGV